MNTYALPASIVALAIALVASVFFYNAHLATGSVAFGNEYKADHVTSADAYSTSTLSGRSGTVGSIVVTSAGTAGSISFYQTASTTIATSSATLLFTFDATAAEGTYTYDVTSGSGILMEVTSGFDANAVVTYRD